MSDRKIYIGPYQIGTVDGTDTHVREHVQGFSEGSHKESHVSDFRALFYASMIQAGVEGFEIPEPMKEKLAFSDFITNRTTFLDAYALAVPFLSVLQTFEHNMPDGFMEKEEYAAARGLMFFLTDLMVAIERKVSIAVVSSIPDLTKIADTIPPHLLFPIRNLFSTIQVETACLPLPKKYVQAEHLERYQKIITSDLFNDYKKDHEGLENNLLASNVAIRAINSSGKSLFKKEASLLKLKQASISLIPLSSKVIDIVFGKLPGTLAEFFGSKLSDWLKEDRRIVIYELESVKKDFLASVYKQHPKSLEDKSSEPAT